MTGGMQDGPTSVTIFGRTYSLRGEGDPAHLSQLAGEVDRRMREIANATGTADTLKVAILTALNIADENLRNQRAGVADDAQDALDRMVRLLDEALVETGGRSSQDAAGRAE